jgi:stage V sporulation protein G
MPRKAVYEQSFGPDRRISADPLDDEIIDRLLNMKITEITIHPTNEGLVRAYVNIVFDNCFAVGEIRVMQGPTGLFVSFPAKKQRDGSDRELAYPANVDTRMMIQRDTGGVRKNRC